MDFWNGTALLLRYWNRDNPLRATKAMFGLQFNSNFYQNYILPKSKSFYKACQIVTSYIINLHQVVLPSFYEHKKVDCHLPPLWQCSVAFQSSPKPNPSPMLIMLWIRTRQFGAMETEFAHCQRALTGHRRTKLKQSFFALIKFVILSTLNQTVLFYSHRQHSAASYLLVNWLRIILMVLLWHLLIHHRNNEKHVLTLFIQTCDTILYFIQFLLQLSQWNMIYEFKSQKITKMC